MKTKLCLLTLFFLLFEFAGYAQETGDILTHTKYKHYIGAAAGLTTGYGMSYRYWPTRFGAQGTFGLSGSRNSNNVLYKARYSFGMAFLYKAVDTDLVNLFFYQGNHYNYYFNTNYSGGGYSEAYWFNGIGLGLELCVDRLSMNLMGGYAAYSSFSGFGLTGEIGLYYRF